MLRLPVGGNELSWSIGVAAGALASGATLYGLGSATRSISGVSLALPNLGLLLVLGVAGLAAVVADLAGCSVVLPNARRQVPQSVADQGAPGRFVFGFEMGTGFHTWMTSYVPYVALLTVLVIGNLPFTLLVSAGFASGRLAGALVVFFPSERMTTMTYRILSTLLLTGGLGLAIVA